MSTITTHVLDTVLGKPAAGIAVRLEHQQDGRWNEMSLAESTDRCRWPLPRISSPNAAPGLYRLTFETGDYFCRHAPHQHLSGDCHHIPLRQRCALSPAAALERQQLHNLPRKLIDGTDWVKIATENRACASRASRASPTGTSSTSGPFACCSTAILKPASPRPTTARFCPPTP